MRITTSILISLVLAGCGDDSVEPIITEHKPVKTCSDKSLHGTWYSEDLVLEFNPDCTIKHYDSLYYYTSSVLTSKQINFTGNDLLFNQASSCTYSLFTSRYVRVLVLKCDKTEYSFTQNLLTY